MSALAALYFRCQVCAFEVLANRIGGSHDHEFATADRGLLAAGFVIPSEDVVKFILRVAGRSEVTIAVQVLTVTQWRAAH